MTLVEGEQALSAWMARTAYVSWIVRARPWELEPDRIAAVDLPLNLQGNGHNQFHAALIAARASCVAQAWALPTVPNQGIGGAHTFSTPAR